MAIPSDGTHTIQIYANDSLGDFYASEKRYFTTNAYAPSLVVSTLTNGSFAGVIAPDFSIWVPDNDLNAT